MFRFGQRSLTEMKPCHPLIQEVNHLAIQYTKVDFGVPHLCGARTITQQADCVRRGVSKTMHSNHLIRTVREQNILVNNKLKTYPMGNYAMAVDNVPYINGEFVWSWSGCYEMICAFDRAATEMGVASYFTWGGAWDRRLSDFGGDVDEYAKEVEAYKRRHPGPDFIDGPHIELKF